MTLFGLTYIVHVQSEILSLLWPEKILLSLKKGALKTVCSSGTLKENAKKLEAFLAV